MRLFQQPIERGVDGLGQVTAGRPSALITTHKMTTRATSSLERISRPLSVSSE